MEDIELDADGNSLMGTMQTVRKSISLNLKKGKPKPKTSKSSKSKKERKEYRDDDKVSRRSKVSSSDKKNEPIDDDEREDEELDWTHEIMFLGEKVHHPMIHICEKCMLPILIYGRLNPCKHVFCLSCAEKSSGKCSRCEERIERIEPAGIGQIFVCSFGGSRNGISGCRRSYLSKRDLFAHIKHRHEKEGSNIQENELALQQQQQNSRLPYFQSHLPPHSVVAGLNLQNPNQPIANPVMLAGLQSGGQQQIFVDANRMPLLTASGQAQFQSLTPNMGITQPQFQGSTFLPTSRNQFPNLTNQAPPGIQSSNSTRNEGPTAPGSNPNLSRVTTPQAGGLNIGPPPNDWRSGTSLQSAGPDWNQSSSYQQQYYK